jgi:hypothetical protein
MATWIAHLRIAENLLTNITGLDAAQFAIGNIAPDSGIPDENWEKFNPPPQVTHFKRSDSIHKDIADLDFYRAYLANISPQDSLRFSFRLGYFFHLITDNLWTIKVGKPTEEKYPDQFAADKNFIWEVKKDWYGLDQIFVRTNPGCLFWRVFLPFDPSAGSGRGFTQGEPDFADLDFLPPEALTRQLEYIKNFYQRRDEKIDEMCARPFVYLSSNEMDSFVGETSTRLLQIHQILWPHAPAMGGLYSALELIG